MRLQDCHNFHDFRRMAQRRLPGPIFNYIDGAADDEVTYRRNTAAFEECDLVPSVLQGVRTVDLSTTVLGQKLDLPAQVAQMAACNSQHSLPQRLARWLLLAHDRMDGDELALTQEFLGIMLGVRRSGVTVALGLLQATTVINQRRGYVVIRDRPGLEAAACGCHERVQAFAAAVAARPSGIPDPADLAA